MWAESHFAPEVTGVSTVLIIGASRGSGFEQAGQCQTAGDRVVATVRDEAVQAAFFDAFSSLVH